MAGVDSYEASAEDSRYFYFILFFIIWNKVMFIFNFLLTYDILFV